MFYFFFILFSINSSCCYTFMSSYEVFFLSSSHYNYYFYLLYFILVVVVVVVDVEWEEMKAVKAPSVEEFVTVVGRWPSQGLLVESNDYLRTSLVSRLGIDQIKCGRVLPLHQEHEFTSGVRGAYDGFRFISSAESAVHLGVRLVRIGWSFLSLGFIRRRFLESVLLLELLDQTWTIQILLWLPRVVSSWVDTENAHMK